MYLEFLEKTGLKELIQNHLINNLVDYVLGVEVGLDSNGRKNRGGHLMEDLLESYIQQLDVEYYKEMYTRDIESKWNIDLSILTNTGDVAKRFDFVVKTDKQIYVFETNFYKSGGSKLNETARSYKTITEEISRIDGITFIWVTDGLGWKSARHNLKETFDVLDTLFNIKDLEDHILNDIIL
jgi:type II restriction enzyme